MTEYQIWSLVIEAVGVIATVIIIFIALFGEKIKQLWNSPKLKIDLTEPTCNITGPPSKQWGWYYRIKVWNKRKRVPAENTILNLNKVYKKTSEYDWQEQHFSGPSQINWQWTKTTPRKINIGYNEEIATFGSILEHGNLFNLKLYEYPNNLRRSIQANEPTVLEFQAVAYNAKSKPLLVEVSWNGEWSNKELEMKKKFVVHQIKKI